MNIQQPVEDSRVNCGSCQNLDLAGSIMGCSYWLAGCVYVCAILVRVYSRVSAACLQVLALVLTQGQLCLSVLSVLTDNRLQGGVWGLEVCVHWRHTSAEPDVHASMYTQTNTFKKIYHIEDVYMQHSSYTNTLDLPSHPRQLFITISPSSSVLWGSLPISSSFIHIDLRPLWPLGTPHNSPAACKLPYSLFTSHDMTLSHSSLPTNSLVNPHPSRDIGYASHDYWYRTCVGYLQASYVW